MFLFCSYHAMSNADDASLRIPPCPMMVRFVPARPPHAPFRRVMRDFTGFLVVAWAAAEIALWAGGA